MNKKRLCICLWVAAATVAMGSLLLLLGLTVFKPKHPITTVDSIAISDLHFSIDVAQLRAHLNVSLNADVTVKNPNRVGFKYADSSAYLIYRDNEVGEARIPAGDIGGGAARSLNLTLTVIADRLLSGSDFYSDVISGTLPLQTSVKLPGKLRLLVDISVVAYASCDLEIHLAGRSLDQKCHYTAKL
ncbi:hypothetical protein Salat_2031400 [Sesamum alatum]|uniref:Late embryogenesis abundant protein LEA-2 subgroup domain-containing protein n=1 Tax=Sesamum alatum TaxID=300844 RepID=A0AAE1Y047_9LAMI|nr:hypothetical protein Salat_2031400 [Sesamum alatum]